MRSLLKSSTGILLAALLLAWTSLCGAGMVSHCSIGDHDSCDHGVVHFTDSGVPDSSSETPDHHHPGQSGGGCCPLDHEHSAPGTEMLPLHPMAVSPPVFAEIFACPVPPSFILTSLESQPPVPPGRVSPAPPPPHLACGPLLV